MKAAAEPAEALPTKARVLAIIDTARTRWLHIEEIYDVLLAEQHGIVEFDIRAQPMHMPAPGTIVMYKRTVKGFRKDGYSWRMKEGQQRQGQYAEGHMKLRHDGKEVVNVYYGT